MSFDGIEGVPAQNSRLSTREPLRVRFKTLLGMPEEVPADEDAAKVKEGFMELRESFVANVEPPEAMEPRQGAFNDPARAAEAAAVGAIAVRKQGCDATLPEFGAMAVRVIAPIALDGPGLRSRGAGAPADAWDVID